MDLTRHLPDERYVREYWPLFVGVAIIVVGNAVYYGYMGNDWQPASPPLFVALAVVVVLEIGRSIADR